MRRKGLHPALILLTLALVALPTAPRLDGGSRAHAQTGGKPVAGGTLTIAYAPLGTQLDVNSTNLSTLNEVAHYFYETLFDRDAEGKVRPLLVAEERISGDGLTVTWKLQAGVKFHDGTPFNAAAVKWNLERKLQKKQPVYDILPIRNIEVVDDLTARVVLTRPSPSLAASLSAKTFSMYSPSFAQKVGDDALKQQASGTGPFTVAEFKPNEFLSLKKNPSYWQKGLPYLDGVVFRVVPDSNTRATMLQAGDVDMALGLSVPDLQRFRRTRGIKVLEGQGSHQYYIALNTRKPPLDDLRVRLALNHAVDKEGIIKAVLLGAAKPSTAPYITEAVDGYVNAGVYGYDPDRAKKLLDEAGWKPGPGGIREKSGKPLRLDLITRKGAVTGDFETAELVQAFLKAVGIDCTLTVLETATFFDRVTLPIDKAQYDMVSLSVNAFTGDAELTMLTFYHSNAFAPRYFNRTYYGTAQIDKLISDSQQATTRAARNAIYDQVIKEVFQAATIIQLVDPPQMIAVQDNVHGVYLAGAQNNWPAKYAWKIK